MNSYSASESLLERELKVSPLASQTYSKSYRYFCKGMAPVYIEKGRGSHLFDVDGNEFIDFICALGPITVGYCIDEIDSKVKKQIEDGCIFSLQHPNEVILAEKICEIIPCAEMVRFLKNGSDATSAAIRLARAYTGRDIVLMCGYHGMHDWSIGASENNRGVPKAVGELTYNFSYNDIEDLKNKLEINKGKVAAVILEPIQGNGPLDNYLDRVRELAHEYGAVLIFDEVVSGFRYALGGASELYNVTPDLVAIGKGMGNGYAIAAVAGRRNIMKLIEEGVFVSTTFGGDVIGMTAALATLSILKEPDFYDRIWKLGNKMKNGLKLLIDKYELNDVIQVTGLAPHCGLNFEGYGSLSYLDIQSVYSQTMIENGILVFAICNLCKAHSESDIDEYLRASDLAFANIRKVIESNSVDNMLKGGKVDPVFKRNIK